MGNPSPIYKFGSVNIFSKHPELCGLNGRLKTDSTKPCGGTLTFQDALIEFLKRAIPS